MLALVAFAFVASITPGPNNLMLMASGANFGLVRSLPHLFGISIGFVVMVAMVGAGLAQVFATYPSVYRVLQVASVVYLLYLAWKIATAAGPGSAEADGQPLNFLQAALFQWVNPSEFTLHQLLGDVGNPGTAGAYQSISSEGV